MPLPVHPTVPALARAVRALHTTRARAQQLVGVPDPVSHLRPLLYTDAPGAPRPTDARAARIHPYSLREFRDPDAHADPARARADELGEYELRMHTARVDALDHAFWAETNKRFEAAKAVVLDSLPPSASAIEREQALSAFYGQWVAQEAERQTQYAASQRRRTRENVALAARVWWRTFRARWGM